MPFSHYRHVILQGRDVHLNDLGDWCHLRCLDYPTWPSASVGERKVLIFISLFFQSVVLPASSLVW